MHLRVVKLGGSLLSLPRLRDRIDRWLAAEPEAVTLMLVGGGSVVDAVRELSALHQYDEEFLHWLCIDLLDVSYRLLSAQLHDWASVTTASGLEVVLRERACAPAEPCRCLVSVAAFYASATESQLPIQLPRSWDTTSDSIAALLAQVTNADELVLLKSCNLASPAPQSRPDWEKLARLGVVDNAFPVIADGLPCVRCANL